MSEPRPVPAPRPSRRSALLLWTIAGAGLLLTNLLSLPLSRVLAGLNPFAQSLIYNLVYYLPFAALPALLLARHEPGLWQAYRPYPISLFSTISIIALALLGVFFVTDMGILWSMLLEALGLRFADVAIALPTSAQGLALCLLYLAVLPGVCEEFVFRGAILSAFEEGGTRRAVVVTALLFALLHGSVEGLPMQFLIGLILGWLVIYCDSIYAGLIYHTTHNAATVILQFTINRSASAALEAQTESASTLELVGGLSGVLQLLLELAMMGAMMLFSLRMFRMMAQLRGVTVRPPQPRAHLRASEWVILALGIVCVALLFAADVYTGLILGGAK